MRKQNWWMASLLPLFLMGCPAQSPEEGSVANDDADSSGIPEGLVYMESFASDGLRTATSIDSGFFNSFRMIHQDFSLADYRRLAEDEINVVTSAMNKQLLLSLVALGATGTTLAAVSDASGLTIGGELTHALINDWDQHLAGLEGVTTSYKLWGQERYLFANDYLENQAGFYGPEMTVLDFQLATVDSATQINDTLSAPLLINSIDHRTRLVVTQSLEIDRDWLGDLSKEIFSGRFEIGAGQRWVDMMRFQGLLNVAETEQYRAVDVPLVGQDLALLVIEPKGLFGTVQDSLDQLAFQQILDQLSPQQSEIVIPLFGIEMEFRDDELADLGVALVESSDLPPSNTIIVGDEMEETEHPLAIEEISDNEANFFPVNQAGYLYLDDRRQQVTIAVTTDGVSTAATSAIVHRAKRNEPSGLIGEGGDGSWSSVIITIPAPSFTSCYYPPDQRSFIFILYARTSGTLLAIGHVTSLEGEAVAADWINDLGGSGCGNSPPVKIYQHTGAVQCESSGVDLYTMKEELLNAGINVLEWGWGTDGLDYSLQCGSATGDINRFTIPEQSLEFAQSLGFALLSDLKNPKF